MSVFRAVVGVIVVLRRRGWQKTIEGGKTQTLVFVFGFFPRYVLLLLLLFFGGSLSVFSAFLAVLCLFFGFST